MRFNLFDVHARERAVDRQHVVDAGLFRVEANFASGICRRALELAHDRLRRIEQADGVVRVGIVLAHFRRWIVEPHDAGTLARVRNQWCRQCEGLAEELVETLSNVARQLYVLALVVSHRYGVGLVEQDVSGHQNRIVQQPHTDRLALTPRLALELGHPVQPAERCHAVEDPGKLRVSRHLRLDKDRGAFGVDSGRQVDGSELTRQPSQFDGVEGHRHRVQVDDAEKVVVLVLGLLPAFYRTEVVTKVQIASRLYARQHPGTVRTGAFRRIRRSFTGDAGHGRSPLQVGGEQGRTIIQYRRDGPEHRSGGY